MPDPIKTGSLKDRSFAIVYHAIAGNGRTGVLDIIDPKEDKIRNRLYFLSGDSSFVTYGPPELSIGQLLIKEGLASKEQVQDVIKEQKENKRRLGEILVSRGIVTKARLHEIVVFQTELKTIHCFGYTDEIFKFTEQKVSEFKHNVPLYKINPVRILYMGVSKHYSIDRLEREFEHLKGANLGLSEDYVEKIAAFPFPPEEEDFIKGIGKGRPFGQLIGGSKLGLTRTLKVLYPLMVAGAIKRVEGTSIGKVKVKEKPSPRRRQGTVELPDVDNVETQMVDAAKVAAGNEEDFAGMVGDYLKDRLEKGESGGGKSDDTDAEASGVGEMVVAEREKSAIEVSSAYQVLADMKKDAIGAYLSKAPTEEARRLADALLSGGVIDGAQLEAAYKYMREQGTSLLNAFIELDALADEDLHELLSEHFKLPAVNLADMELDQDIVSLVPQEFAMKHRLIPINRAGQSLIVAMSNPKDINAIDEVAFLTGYTIDTVVATESSIKSAIDKYHDSADMLDDIMSTFDDSDIDVADMDDDFDVSDVMNTSGQAPIIKLVNKILVDAIGRNASDIHIEPYEKEFRIRYRIDGTLYEVMKPPMALKNPIIARIKIMSQLDIAERRMPQDGRIKLKLGKGKEMDYRVSILPTLWGEKGVLRLLDKSNLQLDMTKLGFMPRQLEDFKMGIHQPYGMVLVTGPTGSGKSTTLYSALAELNTIDTNISTAEDPVEFNLQGINQVQMKDEIGLNFAFTLRSFLRQDPDIIMVGEIRDYETAEIAIKAALTGHLVLSTLHTNDAPGTVNRLLNMGAEPFLVASSVNVIQAQRLARRICEQCKAPMDIETDRLIELGMSPEEAGDTAIFQGEGCSNCNETGYKGRTALSEVMYMSEPIKECVLNGATTMELKREAMDHGMITLRQAALHRLKEGSITPEEVVRNTAPDTVS